MRVMVAILATGMLLAGALQFADQAAGQDGTAFVTETRFLK
jgi:hypothetical protein